jgi:hypothetical protein
MNSYILFKRGILVALVAIFFAGGVGMFDSVESADLSSVKVELSTPRLSFHGKLAAGHTAGETLVTIKNTGPSESTANLFVGEDVTIGAGTHEVIDADDGLTFQIDSPGLSTVAEDTDVYVARATDMSIAFTPVSKIDSGKWIIKVPAGTTSGTGIDGNPDQNGWDTAGTAVATCTDGITTVSPTLDSGYHVFECSYNSINNLDPKSITIEGLINPSPSSNHTIGTADQLRVIIQHSDGTNVIDQTTTAVALIEAVRITASVAPSIELQLLGVSSSTPACGETTSETTTPTEVPLGELSIQNFTTAAQQLKVSTNAQNGYVVTAIAEDQLRRQHVAKCTGNGSAVSGCIPDSAGDGSGMTKDLSDGWSSTDTKGFAYTLDYVGHASGTAPTMEFKYNQSGSNQYRQFADEEDGESPVTLFSSDTVADSHLVNICYKAIIGATQEAGEDYATNVTYRATATF